MNLGQAVAVCLFEITRTARVPAVSEQVAAAKSEDIERLTQLLHESLVTSGYAKGKDETEIVRRLVRRLKPSSADAQLLLGMLRQMLWKMRNRN